MARTLPPKRGIGHNLTALIVLWLVLTVDILWPVISNAGNSRSSMILPEPDGVDYLVVAPQGLGRVASAWADYRQSTGYKTRVVLLAPGQAMPGIIHDLIQETYAGGTGLHRLYVLLIGHAHPLSSHPGAFLPTAYFSVDSNQFPGYGAEPIASDDVFIGKARNGIPEHSQRIFIGRIPIRTNEEGLGLLERTRKYEELPPVGQGRARVELVSSDAGFGPQYEPIFRWALTTLTQKALPHKYQWHMLDGNAQSPYSYPIDLFPAEVAKRFDSGALALVYIGHGQPELLGWAYSLNGSRGRIFGFEDAGIIQNAHASLGIFTACSAGRYDLAGDDPSVVESIFLTPGGPVGTYSSSAWINGTANGHLLISLFEALLIDKAATLGEWVERTESQPDPTLSPTLLAQVIKGLIPMISGLYQGKVLLSPAQAEQELDIQHATYNLFGDPALSIAYPEEGMDVSPRWVWQPLRDRLAIFGEGRLPAGQHVSLALEALPGDGRRKRVSALGTADRYQQENRLVLATGDAVVTSEGKFATELAISPAAPSGKYLLRAVSVRGNNTYISAHPVYLGWPPVVQILSSTVFWWLVVACVLLGSKIRPKE